MENYWYQVWLSGQAKVMSQKACYRLSCQANVVSRWACCRCIACKSSTCYTQVQYMSFACLVQVRNGSNLFHFNWLYTLPQKKRNFSEVAFVLGRSVGQWTLGQIWKMTQGSTHIHSSQKEMQHSKKLRCCGQLPVTPRSISLGGHDLGSLTLVQGHHKNSGNLSCVSFGEECTQH